jgi:hypothetical protein
MSRYIVSTDEKKVGEEVEKRFMGWLNRYGIVYTRIDQTPEAFSKGLKDKKAKRPDFTVTLTADKEVLVDTKHLPPTSNRYYNISINEDEINKLLSAQNEINKPIFLVFSGKEAYDFSLWFSIKVDGTIKSCEKKVEGTERPFFVVPLKMFRRVGYSCNPSLLFSSLTSSSSGSSVHSKYHTHTKYPNKGKKWSFDEDNRLKERYRNLKAARMSEKSIIETLSSEFGRNEGGIVSRLKKYQLLPLTV